MNIKLMTNNLALYIGTPILVFIVVLSFLNLIAPTSVSAVFDPEVVEDAKKDFPDETSSPSPSASVSATPGPSTSIQPKGNNDDIEDTGSGISTTKAGEEYVYDWTPWAIGGGVLAVLLLSGLLLSKTKR